MAYLSNALEQMKMAKQYDQGGVLEMAIFHTRKAIKIMEQLHVLRKDNYPEYQVLLAPFYYKIGESLVSYIECNMNEMNQLKPLVLPEDELSQQDDNEEEKVPEASQNSEEPLIEDIIDSGAVKQQSP